MKYTTAILALAISVNVSALKVLSLGGVDPKSKVDAMVTDKPWDGNSNGTHWTTVVSTDYETYCPEPTTMTHGGKTYTVTKPMTITITDCPCTFTHPITTTSTEEPCTEETQKPEESTKKPFEPSTITYTTCDEESATATATETPCTETGTASPEHPTAPPMPEPTGSVTKTNEGHATTKGSQTQTGNETGSPVSPTHSEFTGAAAVNNGVEGGVLGLMVWGAALLL